LQIKEISEAQGMERNPMSELVDAGQIHLRTHLEESEQYHGRQKYGRCESEA
jgi:hypothetical protein